jgi:ferredoxin
MPKVTFNYDGQIKTVTGDDGKTILRIALDNNIPMEHACGGNGFCTTCISRIQKGAENVSKRSDREENMGITSEPYRLSCQTRVHGDITVEIPE